MATCQNCECQWAGRTRTWRDGLMASWFRTICTGSSLLLSPTPAAVTAATKTDCFARIPLRRPVQYVSIVCHSIAPLTERCCLLFFWTIIALNCPPSPVWWVPRALFWSQELWRSTALILDLILPIATNYTASRSKSGLLEVIFINVVRYVVVHLVLDAKQRIGYRHCTSSHRVGIAIEW